MLNPTRFTALLLLVMSLAACSSSPSQQASTTDAAEQSTTAEQSATSGDEASAEEASVAVAFDPIKCVRYTPSGTRISQRVCKKKSEWDRIREENQRALQDAQRRSVHENQTL